MFIFEAVVCPFAWCAKRYNGEKRIQGQLACFPVWTTQGYADKLVMHVQSNTSVTIDTFRGRSLKDNRFNDTIPGRVNEYRVNMFARVLPKPEYSPRYEPMSGLYSMIGM